MLISHFRRSFIACCWTAARLRHIFTQLVISMNNVGTPSPAPWGRWPAWSGLNRVLVCSTGWRFQASRTSIIWWVDHICRLLMDKIVAGLISKKRYKIFFLNYYTVILIHHLCKLKKRFLLGFSDSFQPWPYVSSRAGFPLRQ